MWPTTERFQRWLGESHRVAYSVEIRNGGVLVASDLKIVSGSSQEDYYADVRRTCQCVVVGLDPDQLPTSTRRSPVDIYGNELLLSLGVQYHDGRRETVPQGVYRITDAHVVDTAKGVGVSITGADRSSFVGLSSLRPYSVAVGVGFVDAIVSLVQSKLPNVEISRSATNNDVTTTPVFLEEDANRWTDGAGKLALAAGAQTYFDREGRLVIEDVPSFATRQAVWEFVSGPRCTVTKLDVDYSERRAFNAVVVTSSSTTQDPVRAEALNLDTSSPTYYYGRYGEHVDRISSPLASTTAIAQRMADTRLRQHLGNTEEVTITAMPHYSLDTGDVVRVERSRIGIDGHYVVSTKSMPWSTKGNMVLTCRTRRSVT